MGKKWRLCRLGVSLMVLITMTPLFYGAVGEAKLECGQTSASETTNTIGIKLKITNTSGKAMRLSDLKARYYYTIDQEIHQMMWCDHAAMMSSNGYETVTQLVKGEFVDLDEPVENADTYLEVSFEDTDKLLPNGGTVEMQIRITNKNWSNYTQTNDYSFMGKQMDYAIWENITLYYQDELISGMEPTGTQEEIKNAELSKASLSYDFGIADLDNVALHITLNGNELTKVTCQGQVIETGDYTFDENGIFNLSERYLSTLEVGTYQLVFDFNKGRDGEVNLVIEDTRDKNFAIVVEKSQLNEGEEGYIHVKLQNVEEGINNANFSLNYDRDVLEILEVIPGAIIPEADKSFRSTVIGDKVYVLFVGYDQLASSVVTQDGEWMRIKVRAKQDITENCLSLNAKSHFANYALDTLPVVFKFEG